MPRREAEARLTRHDRAKEAAKPRLQSGKQHLLIHVKYDMERRQVITQRLACSFAPIAFVRGEELDFAKTTKLQRSVQHAGLCQETP